MDRRLLHHYNAELSHLRRMGQEFAREFPKIASGLAIDVTPCPDPYVERLLEGFAFMAARIQLKMEAEFPRFTHSLLESVYPHFLAPTPSMAIVQMSPDLREGTLAEGFEVPRHTMLRSAAVGRGATACEFSTAHAVTLWPLKIVEAAYHTQDLAQLGLPQELKARAAVRIRIESTGGVAMKALAMDSLTLHITGNDPRVRARLYEQIFTRALDLVIQPPTTVRHRVQEVVSDWRVPVGFEDDEALLRFDSRSFNGYRLLKEYFTLPERFQFVELRGLRPAVARCLGTQLDLIIPFSVGDLDLERAVTADNFALFCTPAINLFSREADRIYLNDSAFEHQVIPDRTRPLDFEVYQVRSVTGIGISSEETQEFSPFYLARDAEVDARVSAYFGVHRVPRTLSERERMFGPRSVSYPGSEVYLSLVDARNAPLKSDVRQLSVKTLCTNRDLPLHLPQDAEFNWDIGAPLESVRALTPPTPPRPSWAEGDASWRLISHLCLNYLSLVDTDERAGAQALREMLRLYSDLGEPQFRRQVEQGVRSVATKPITRRVMTPGPITFARGLEVTVVLEELAFEGTGVFLLASVLDRFFSRYVSMNSFTEMVLKTPERGEVMRWPTRIGRRTTI
jgi:type VI secretion system protein ImpG